MGVTQIKQWFNRLKNGGTSVESDEYPGRPQTARNDAVVEKVRHRILVKEHVRNYYYNYFLFIFCNIPGLCLK
ncbi:hypothetical protein C0J52_26934 [Blattella germanica]|nr:hypothetical protein C0J52_26934 [Blattella germanica]